MDFYAGEGIQDGPTKRLQKQGHPIYLPPYLSIIPPDGMGRQTRHHKETHAGSIFPHIFTLTRGTRTIFSSSCVWVPRPEREWKEWLTSPPQTVTKLLQCVPTERVQSLCSQNNTRWPALFIPNTLPRDIPRGWPTAGSDRAYIIDLF